MQKKNRYLYYSILPCCLLLIVIGSYAFGYKPPTANPPFDNLPAPINAGLDPQTKSGNLTIDGLLKIGRYTSAPTGSTGALYYDTTENAFKGYKAAAWADLGGTASVSSVFGRTGAIVATTGDYTKAMVGLGSVDDTADSVKNVKYATTAGSAPKGSLSCTTVACNWGSYANGILCSCPSGYLLTGGGRLGKISGETGALLTSAPEGNAWRCYNPYHTSGTCYARCCKVS